MGQCVYCLTPKYKNNNNNNNLVDISLENLSNHSKHSNKLYEFPTSTKNLNNNKKNNIKFKSFKKLTTTQHDIFKKNTKNISTEALISKTKTINNLNNFDITSSIGPISMKNTKIIKTKNTQNNKKSHFSKNNFANLEIEKIISENKEDNKQSENYIIENEDENENFDDFEEENVVVTKEQEKKVLNMLKKHFLFKHFSEKMLQIIIDNSVGYCIDEGSIIYCEGDLGQSFFIIQNGKVEITKKNSNEKKILSFGEGFGEAALIYPEVKRTETAVALTKLNFYVILGSSYRETSKNYSKHSIEQIIYLINGNSWLCNIDPVIKLNLASLINLEEYEKNELIFSHKNENDFPNKIYLVKSGSLLLINNDNKNINYLYPKDYFGEKEIILDINDKFSYNLISNEFSSCYVITKEILIEAIGQNYKDEILFSIFKNGILKNSFFKTILLESYFQNIFSLFKIKIYKNEELIYSKNFKNNENEKAVLILNGCIADKSDYITIANQGILYGDEIINSNISLDLDLIAYNPYIEKIIALECNWIDIRNKLEFLSKNSNSLDLFKRVKKLTKIYLFKHINESKILELCQSMKKEIFPKNTTIINVNDNVNNFYIISKGKILVIKNNNLVREIDEGNCFGEFYLLNDEKSSEQFITYSDTQCYILSKETFFNFLIDENMNDYIKKKMCLEDNSIQLKDLFHICVLGKGRFGTVCLVHNTISLYAIKIIPKVYFENDKQMQKYLLTEKKIMLSLDYPLIIKLVKTLKTDNLCFFLLEFINGINLEDLISSKVILKNIPEVTFFAACISLILDYLNKNHIIHRDIKPSNILINHNGYYKITDFGTSKIIKDFTFTSLGTPNYMAPEILIGKGYSYPADYFSFGVCLFFMYYGKYPFGEGKKEIMDIYDDILHKNIVFPNNESNVENLNNFISNLLNKNPINRPCSLYRIKNFSFFNKFEWNLLETFKMKPPFKLKNSEIKNENNCLKNKRTLFLDFISKNKFENSLFVNKNNSYDTKRDYSNWFDIF